MRTSLFTLPAALALPLLTLTACGDKDDDDGDDTGGVTETDADADGFSAEDDCDDSDAAVNPDAAEVCDGVDNNCDGLVDDDDPAVELSTGRTFYGDADHDGHGDADAPVQACALPEGAAESDDDCDDADPAIRPSATEICDDADVDEDCSGDADDADPGVDPATQTTTWPDADGDGFGDADDPGTASCDPPSGGVEDATDCDDADPAIHPDATEVCDDADVDEDCDGVADDADDSVDSAGQGLGYPDSDGDGYGADSDGGSLYCDLPSAVVADATDCDDGDAAVNPGATEVCDESDVDEDCDGDTNDDDASVDPATQSLGHIDTDGDGYGDADDAGTLYCALPSGVVSDATDCDDAESAVNPGATEVCDAVDNDCDATTSESGMVSFTSASGLSSDATATYSGGTASTPVDVALATAGTLSFCDDTFYVNLAVEADLSIVGVLGTEVLDGAGAGTVVAIETDAVIVSIENLTIQNGVAEVDAFSAGPGTEGGGGIVCASTASLDLDQVVLSQNEGYAGGGLASNGCTVDIVDSELSDNLATFGAGMMVGDGDISLVGSDLSLNTADTTGGGLYAFTDAVVSFSDTRIEGNEANFGGGVQVHGADVSCTGTATADASIIGNTAAIEAGGVRMVSGASTSAFTATLCDLGASGTADDNVGQDVYIDATDVPYAAGDGATFTCDDTGCGTEQTFSVGDTPSGSDQDDYIKGNVFLADTDATLHGFRQYLGPASTCELDFYVLSSSTGTGAWTVEWSDTGRTASSSSLDWQAADDIDLIVASGTYYALVTGFRCSSGQVSYRFFNADTADDAGFGTHHASYNDSSYSAVLGTTTSSGSLSTSSGRARYGMEVDVTEL